MAKTLLDLTAATGPGFRLRALLLSKLNEIKQRQIDNYMEDNPGATSYPAKIDNHFIQRRNFLASLDYYLDTDSFWIKENFGVRLVDNWRDLVQDRKYNPLGGRFEHLWYAPQVLGRWIEEETDRFTLVYNFPTMTRKNAADGECIVLDQRREITWEKIQKKWQRDKTDIV